MFNQIFIDSFWNNSLQKRIELLRKWREQSVKEKWICTLVDWWRMMQPQSLDSRDYSATANNSSEGNVVWKSITTCVTRVPIDFVSPSKESSVKLASFFFFF